MHWPGRSVLFLGRFLSWNFLRRLGSRWSGLSLHVRLAPLWGLRCGRNFGDLKSWRFCLFGVCCGRSVRRATGTGQAAAQLQRDIVVQRTGVRFLVCNPEFGQQIKDHVGLDL
jgi:hypothetical protein